MADIFTTILNGIQKKFADLGTHHAEVVVAVNADGSPIGGSGPTTDRELVVSTYRCKTAFTGASVGDTITATQIIDVSGDTPTTVSTIWRNQTTAADLASAPSAANLELNGTTALTAAQLTAAGLALEVTQQQVRDRLPATMPTPGLLPVDALATPTAMTPDTVTSVSKSLTLSPATRRVSVDASVAVIVRINAAASVPANGTALPNAVAIPEGGTKDFDVPASTTLHYIRDGAADGTIRISELA